jgi:hypothetical protein
MFCSACGNQLVTGLSFCNKCGAPTGAAKDKDKSRDPDLLSESSINFLVAGMIGIPIAGIGVIIGLVSVLKKELHFEDGVVLTFTLMAFILLLAAELGILFLLFTRTRSSKKYRESLRENEVRFQPQAELREGITNALGEARGTPVGSVTENTTRSFEHVRNKTTENE